MFLYACVTCNKGIFDLSNCKTVGFDTWYQLASLLHVSPSTVHHDHTATEPDLRARVFVQWLTESTENDGRKLTALVKNKTKQNRAGMKRRSSFYT